ncbi:MAG: dihydrolipoyl dehydrogenase [Kiritimatiellia bacterium]|nr:dihydrolipoyl dehydrogenase [Kiritimatiellia bacterium]MDP6631222.1 dihydrolipoyl dehydrogenase [Kiritimatiellia bacterium]MDP6809553.1 dihydrolipoyl dehydrogenase [Kiritimatiellia bacterium]MDP7023596.1 dihydrolipoyl dehydrogenase [Kiritimatiellia bacterium]
MHADVSSRHVVVIGAGPGGYPAAFHAADLGMQVTLIDSEANPGGVCLYRGCIPSKALLHAAAIINEAKEAADWGITLSEPQIDLDKLRARKQAVIDKLTGGLGQLSKQRKITYLQGRAAFKDARALTVTGADGAAQEVTFDAAIIATGSQPIHLPFAPPSDRILDSTTALDLADVPDSLLLVGGGYIGLELGQVYASLGSRVTVVEMMPTLLPGADAALVRVLSARLKKQFENIHLETRVAAVEDGPDGVQVTFEGKHEASETFDKLLVAVGRRPDTNGLGLENTGVTLDDQGFVTVDAQRRTSEPTIYAVGDVAGQPMLAHKATYEGKVAAEAIAGKKTVYDPKAVPGVVFTDPELAWCGITEAEAKEAGREVTVTSFPWAASGRATTLGRSDGVTRLIVDPADSNRLLGVGMAGPGAGELIAEGTLAIEMGAVADDLAWTIHPHPTLSETIMEAAESAGGHSIHYAR